MKTQKIKFNNKTTTKPKHTMLKNITKAYVGFHRDFSKAMML
ncbi:hypothetical protein ES707_07958 [subsurface metagenome]